MKNFHFLGICGTAMGAFASALARQGHRVTGTDEKAYDPMRSFLLQEGISITEGYSANNIPADTDIVIIGNAMSRGNVEVEETLNRRLRYMSLPEAIKEFYLWGKHNFVVTGTHGKTTTTSLLSWLLEDAGLEPNFLIGGIARNFKRGGRFGDSQYTVLEGDEYDTAFFDKRSKFHHYLPEVVIVNNIEMDHADIFDNLDQVKKTFFHLLRLVPSNGCALVNADCPNCRAVAALVPQQVPVKLVGQCEEADIRIENIQYEEQSSSFTLQGEIYTIPMTGEFNVYNAAMATSAALFAGLSPEQIRHALVGFLGIARRQELRGCERGVSVIDDFAHHPTAIYKAVRALRQRYPQGRLIAVFDPRSNTSGSNLFQKELAYALSEADYAVIAPVERASKFTTETILDLDLLASDILSKDTSCYLASGVEDIVSHLSAQAQEGDTILIMSNGGFGAIHQRLLDSLRV